MKYISRMQEKKLIDSRKISELRHKSEVDLTQIVKAKLEQQQQALIVATSYFFLEAVLISL